MQKVVSMWQTRVGGFARLVMNAREDDRCVFVMGSTWKGKRLRSFRDTFASFAWEVHCIQGLMQSDL